MGTNAATTEKEILLLVLLEVVVFLLERSVLPFLFCCKGHVTLITDRDLATSPCMLIN